MIELIPVGFFVALQEEMLGLVGRNHVRPGCDNLRRTVVAGLEHALRSQYFEALVVTVGRAARGMDLRELAADRAERHGRGVGIIGLGGNRRIGQRAGRGINGCGFFAENPAEDVEIVDQHVLENAARALQVGDRRGAWVPADD